MRWNCPSKSSKIGTKRTVSKFLLFPRCINGKARWLEIATIHQEYVQFASGMTEPPIYGWKDLKWEDEENE